jgi:hypothetical protein
VKRHLISGRYSPIGGITISAAEDFQPPRDAVALLFADNPFLLIADIRIKVYPCTDCDLVCGYLLTCIIGDFNIIVCAVEV